jgi:hypothetical protein
MPKKQLPKAAIKTQFKKGVSGNPLGGKLHNPEIKKIKALTEAELIEVATFILKSTIGQLRLKIKDPNTPALQGMVIGLAIKTMSKGDSGSFNALMDRLLGKVKENFNFSGNVGGTSKVILTMPKNGSEAPDEEIDE